MTEQAQIIKRPTGRWRPIRITAIVLAVLIGVPIVVHRGWACHAERKFEGAVAAIRAAGEPILPEDFNVTGVDEAQNAGTLLLRAARLVVLTDEERKSLDPHELLTESRPAERDEACRLVAANKAAIDLVRQARGLTQVDWGVRIESPLTDVKLPHLTQQGWLLMVMRLAAVHDHLEGRDGPAVEKLRDALSAAKKMGRNPTDIVSHMASLGRICLVARLAELIIPELVVADARPTHGEAATPGQIKGLIGELLDQTSVGVNLVGAFHHQRGIYVDSVMAVVAGRTHLKFGGMGWWGSVVKNPDPADRVGAYIAKPLYFKDGLRLLAYGTSLMEAGRESDWPRARAKLPAKPKSGTKLESHTTLPVIVDSSFDRIYKHHHATMALTRMAAVALAMRLYQLDHGDRPKDLGALVPAYLPAIPKDPLAQDDRWIGYVLMADRAVLYSVGFNGLDDGGVLLEPDYGSGPDEEPGDIVFFLNGDRPRPTTQPKGEQS